MMTDDLTPESIQRDRETIAAATPGPWEQRKRHIGGDYEPVSVKQHHRTDIVGNVNRQFYSSTPVCQLNRGFVWFEGDGYFIAAARTRWPIALEAVLELQTLLMEIMPVLATTAKSGETKSLRLRSQGAYDRAERLLKQHGVEI